MYTDEWTELNLRDLIGSKYLKKYKCGCFTYVQDFFKENVRYLVWTCRDPIL